jgi:hypothetical protein
MTFDDAVAELYALPRGDFVRRRNELAKELRSGGEQELAETIKHLAKPSITAWAVNQLYYSNRESFDALLAAGSEQRRAVAGRADRLRDTAERKRSHQNELLKAAEGILAGIGTKLTPALRQRISRTLDTLAAWPPDDDPPPLGSLTCDLEPAGFDALLGASITAATTAPSRKAKKKAPARVSRATKSSAAARVRRKAARGEVDEAKRELAEARKAATAAKRRLTRAESKAESTLAKAKAAERTAEKAREAADQASLDLRKARAAQERAARASERLEDRLDAAQRKLAAVDG